MRSFEGGSPGGTRYLPLDKLMNWYPTIPGVSVSGPLLFEVQAFRRVQDRICPSSLVPPALCPGRSFRQSPLLGRRAEGAWLGQPRTALLGPLPIRPSWLRPMAGPYFSTIEENGARRSPMHVLRDSMYVRRNADGFCAYFWSASAPCSLAVAGDELPEVISQQRSFLACQCKGFLSPGASSTHGPAASPRVRSSRARQGLGNGRRRARLTQANRVLWWFQMNHSGHRLPPPFLFLQVLLHKLTKLRSASTDSYAFRQLLRELTFYVGYEATRNIKTAEVAVQTPVAPHIGTKIADSVALIPVLRAGLGMTEAMLELLPIATVHHVGMYRSHKSLLPVQYYNRLPRDQEPSDVCIVLEPIIATAATILAVTSILKAWGAKKIIVVACIASRCGLEKLHEAHPDVTVFTADVDESVNEAGVVVPGLGDVGDRLFGTPQDLEADTAVGTKRPRAEGAQGAAESSS